MPSHLCEQEETIGKFKLFLEDCRGIRPTLYAIIIAIVIQIVTFASLWGGLVTTVNNNTKYLWGDMTTTVRENTRNMDKLMTKMESVKFIAVTENNER